MAKRKRKSLGKLKHYKQRSYARRGLLRRRILKWVLGLAILFGVGWLVAGPVVDLGTGLWYSIKNGRQDAGPAASSTSDPAASGSEGASAPESAPPQATPAASTTAIVTGDWSYVALSGLSNEEQAAATAADLAGQGVSYAVITLKDAQGYVYYDSQVELAAPSKAGRLVDAAMAARVFREAGLIPVAGISAFEDPTTPYTDRELAVHYGSQDVIWLNASASAGGVPWLDPTDTAARQYIADLIAEIKGLGFDQFLLSGVQFPSGYSLEGAGYDAGLATEIDKTAQLAGLIDAWQQQADGDGSVLWFEYPADQAALEASDTIGSLAGLGVRNLVLDMDALSPEDDGTQRTAALTAAQNADHLVLHTGVTGSFAR